MRQRQLMALLGHGLPKPWPHQAVVGSNVQRSASGSQIQTKRPHFNKVYRSKTQATNVLSFPADLPPGTPSGLLGDLVICAQVVQQEAKLQNKCEEAHWAHMVIHGVLHLLGHDHQVPTDADAMEALEVELLERFSFPNPYELTESLAGAQP